MQRINTVRIPCFMVLRMCQDPGGPGLDGKRFAFLNGRPMGSYCSANEFLKFDAAAEDVRGRGRRQE